MDKTEFAKIAAGIKTAYPNAFPNQQAMELWYKHLKDLPYNVAQVAVNKYIDVSEFPPTIAAIRNKAKEIMWESLNPRDPRFFEKMNAIEALDREKEVLAIEANDPL